MFLVHLVVLANSKVMLYCLYELNIHVKYFLCKLCCLVVLWPWLDNVILILVTSQVGQVELAHEWHNMSYMKFLGEQGTIYL